VIIADAIGTQPPKIKNKKKLISHMLVFLVKCIFTHSADNCISLGSFDLNHLQRKFCYYELIAQKLLSYQNSSLFMRKLFLIPESD
jgi:hypothetical protein